MLLNSKAAVFFFSLTTVWVHVRSRNCGVSFNWDQEYFGACTKRWQLGRLTVELRR